MNTFRVIGHGRAGGSLAEALVATGEWHLASTLGRGDDVTAAAHGVDLLVIATPDAAIAQVARDIAPVDSTVVAHMAGSLGLEVLAPHARRAAFHPLMTLPDARTGAALLRGSWFAIAGDPIASAVVDSLDGRSFVVADADRALYHAAACVAANHVIALLAQVERLAGAAHVPFAAFFDLVRAAVDNVERLGPRDALTGPAARGDTDTISRHLAAMPADERPAYSAMVAEARRLVA